MSAASTPSTVAGTALLGRCIDAFGAPLDDGPRPSGRLVPVVPQALPPRFRRPLDVALPTGVRAIDGLLTIARGARAGIFGSPGAGKSTLLETIVRGTAADAVVVALAGERGREAERWIERCDARTTVVCETSDKRAPARVRAAFVAMAHARALAERGLHVLVLLDSLARVAYALRELSTAANEPLGRGGYPASVFSVLAALVESAGAFASGSITLLATVLSDGDDRDPVSDSARSLLDGHIALSEKLARAGRFPAIDILGSASRTMNGAVSPEHVRQAQKLRGCLARLSATEELRALGIIPGDPQLHRDLEAEPGLEGFLRQGPEPSAFAQTLAALAQTADILEEPHEHRL